MSQINVYLVKIKTGDEWQGVAANEATAKAIACKCFLCPESSIDGVTITKTINY